MSASKPASRLPHVVWAALGLFTFVLIMWSGRRLGFFVDEWSFVLGRRTGGIDDYLRPHFEHIIVATAFIYKALFATVGLSHFWPYRLVLAVAYVLTATMVYILAGRRVGPWAAVAAGALVLFAGRAHENMTWAFEIQFVGSVLFGLIALWAIQDDSDRRRVALAAVALVIGTLFSSLGLPFVAGVAAELAFRRRWKLLWVPAVTLVMYGAWYLGYGIHAHSTRAGPVDAVWWGLRCAVAGLAGVFGLPQGFGWPLLAGFAGFVAWRLPKTGVTPRFIALAVTGVVYWLLVGMGRADAVPFLAPDSSRYLYVGIVVYILITCELLVGLEIKRPALVATLTVVLVAVSGALGFADMTRDANQRRDVVAKTYAEFSTVELEAAVAPRAYVPDGYLAPEVNTHLYLDHARDAANVDLPHASADARAAADRVLSDIAVKLSPVPAKPVFSSCRLVRVGEVVSARPGEPLKLVAPRAKIEFRRFGDSMRLYGPVSKGGTLWSTYGDVSPVPYKLAFTGPVRVCR